MASLAVVGEPGCPSHTCSCSLRGFPLLLSRSLDFLPTLNWCVSIEPVFQLIKASLIRLEKVCFRKFICDATTLGKRAVAHAPPRRRTSRILIFSPLWRIELAEFIFFLLYKLLYTRDKNFGGATGYLLCLRDHMREIVKNCFLPNMASSKFTESGCNFFSLYI